MLRDGPTTPTQQPGSSIEVLTVKKQHDYADQQAARRSVSGRTDAEASAEANERSQHTGSRNRQKRAREKMEDTSMTEVHRCQLYTHASSSLRLRVLKRSISQVVRVILQRLSLSVRQSSLFALAVQVRQRQLTFTNWHI
jgi:hypothetical protein